MKTFLIACTCFMFFVHGVIHSQEENTTKKPDERITVNKEYDDRGNLIRYDSIYSYSSSNSNLKMEAMDSIFKNFFLNSGTSFFKNSFDFDDFMFPNHFTTMDSILKNRIKDHEKLLDNFFEFNQPNVNSDSTIIKKKNKI